MEAVFLKILNMSITAGWMVLAVVVLRLLLKKAPKWIMGILWGFVAIRLIVPFSLESIFSLIPSAEPIPQNILMAENPAINSGFPILNEIVNPVLSDSLTPNAAGSVNPIQIVLFIFSVIWLIGTAGMLLYTLISYLRIRGKVQEAVRLKENIWLCDHIATPFILGIFRPRIYLPSVMHEADMKFVISHEKAHLKRKDHIWKPLGFFLLSVYWFHPLLWAAYILLCRDIELACDEKVIRQMGTEIKKSYSNALINCSVPRKMISACPLAFGEAGVKERVKGVLSYKKPAFWMSIAAVIICIVTAVCLLTNPARTLGSIEFLSLDTTVAHAENVVVYSDDGQTSVGIISQELADDLCAIKISKKEISKNRSTERDRSHTILLQNETGECYICFDTEFQSVWADNGVKPTLSYKILHPHRAESVFYDIKNYHPFANKDKNIDDNLQVFLDTEIMAHHQSDQTDSNFAVLDYDILKIDRSLSDTTLYLWVYYAEYSYPNHTLQVEVSAHTPTVITVTNRIARNKNGFNHYELREYWVPRDGNLYQGDIQEKFPKDLWGKAMDSERYRAGQEADCRKMAEQYFRSAT